MNTKLIASMGAVLLVNITHASGLYASPNWDGVASGCVPSEDTIAAANFNTANNAINFDGTDTGDIHLMCPVKVSDGDVLTSFYLEYANDGGAAYYVEATLRYVEAGSPTDICTATSDTSGYDEQLAILTISRLILT